MATVSSGCGLDRISDLPSNVIGNILVLLPISEAVRTSTLSKKWKEKWHTLPHIIVDENLFPHSFYRSHEGVIDCILTKHEGKIDKFSVSVEVKDYYIMDSWLWTVARKGVQELFLLYQRGHRNQVPSILFSCHQLRKLSLRRCELEPPRSSRGFQSLISLEFDKVRITTAALEKLISSCPVLEQLTLRKLVYVDHLRINVPKLKYFCFDGEFVSISFSTPSLEVLSINLYRNRYSCPVRNKFYLRFQFCGLPTSIQELYVRCEFQKYLDACDRLNEVVTYSHLRTLQLDEFCFEKLEQVRCLLSLIGSSANLTTLDITACGCESEAVYGPVTKFWEEKNNAPSMTLNQLKKVRVGAFHGKDPEMKLIQYLMANSPALEEMRVEFVENPEFDKAQVEGILQLLCKVSTQLKFIGASYDKLSDADDDRTDYGADSSGSFTHDSD